MSRRKSEEYQKALAVLKNWARRDGDGGWSDDQWKALLARAEAQRAEPEKPSFSLSLRPLASAAAMLLVLVWGAIVLTRAPLRTTGPSEPSPSLQIAAARPAPVPMEDAAARPRPLVAAPAARISSRGGDSPALTWISPETGLKMVWFINDNLKLED